LLRKEKWKENGAAFAAPFTFRMATARYGMSNGLPTSCGLVAFAKVPFPSWPKAFAPQHSEEFSHTPQVEAPPA
jgi:hypothetical protein